jgi:hypothetical protein
MTRCSGAAEPIRADMARKKLPSNAKAIPTEQITRYFQVASKDRGYR